MYEEKYEGPDYHPPHIVGFLNNGSIDQSKRKEHCIEVRSCSMYQYLMIGDFYEKRTSATGQHSSQCTYGTVPVGCGPGDSSFQSQQVQVRAVLAAGSGQFKLLSLASVLNPHSSIKPIKLISL